MNDIDIEYAEAVQKSNRMARARKKHGICFHNSFDGAALTCRGCGKKFATEQAWLDEHDELVVEWC